MLTTAVFVQNPEYRLPGGMISGGSDEWDVVFHGTQGQCEEFRDKKLAEQEALRQKDPDKRMMFEEDELHAYYRIGPAKVVAA